MPQTLSLQQMHAASGHACRLMRSLANPDRLLLLCQLAEREMSVGELEAALGILQPTLSQQLGVLREDGLVATRREGKHIHYRVRSAPALAVLRVLHEQFCRKARKR